PSFIPQTSKIAMAASCCLRQCSECILSCKRCSPTPAIRDRNSTTRCERYCHTSKRRSSSVQIKRDLRYCPSAGSSSVLSPGSTAAEGSPRIGRTSIAKRSYSCASPQSASCSENSAIPSDLSGQTLTQKYSPTSQSHRHSRRNPCIGGTVAEPVESATHALIFGKRRITVYGAIHMVFRDGANPTGITAVSFIVAISTTETLFASGLAT